MGKNDNSNSTAIGAMETLRHIKAYVQKLKATTRIRLNDIKNAVEDMHSFSMQRVIKNVQKLFKSYAKINEIGIYVAQNESLNGILTTYKKEKDKYKVECKKLCDSLKKIGSGDSEAELEKCKVEFGKYKAKLADCRKRFKDERLKTAKSTWKIVEGLTGNIPKLLAVLPNLETEEDFNLFDIDEWKKKNGSALGQFVDKLKTTGDLRILRIEIYDMAEKLRQFGKVNKKFIEMVKDSEIDWDGNENIELSGPN